MRMKRLIMNTYEFPSLFIIDYIQMLARGEIENSESSSDSEDEALLEASPEEQKEGEEEKEEVIEDGEATHRFACVNMNWDNVTVFQLLIDIQNRQLIYYQYLNHLHKVDQSIQLQSIHLNMVRNAW